MHRPPSHVPAPGAVPDPSVEPSGFLVELDDAVRLHFLDWGGPREGTGRTARPVLLVHGLAGTAWVWAPVARRVVAVARTVAIDLRGHGLSDSPTHGYGMAEGAADVIGVAEAAGLLEPATDAAIVLAGHGFGACVAAWTAASLGARCAGLVLLDGGLDDLAEDGRTLDELLAAAAEPPEVMASMAAFLADRRGFEPASWDADQERAARASVVEVPAGHLLPAIRPHAMAASVEAMLAYRPTEVLADVAAPVVALVTAPPPDSTLERRLADVQAARRGAGRPPISLTRWPGVGHNLMRYRPLEVAAALLALATADTAAAARGGTDAEVRPDARPVRG